MNAMLASEVLNRTADVVEEKGYGHGVSSMAAVGGVCVEGAMHIVLTGEPVKDGSDLESHAYRLVETSDAGRALHHYLNLSADDHLYRWNDSLMGYTSGVWIMHTTLEERDRGPAKRKAEAQQKVVETLRACALIEQAREKDPTYVVPDLPKREYIELVLPASMCGNGVTIHSIDFSKVKFSVGPYSVDEEKPVTHFEEITLGDDTLQCVPAGSDGDPLVTYAPGVLAGV